MTPKNRLPHCVLALLLIAATLQTTGCGQTGALYFDEDPPADQLPPSRKSQPVSVPQPAPDETEVKKESP